MDLAAGSLLFGAGIAGGVVTAIVGGSSLITFPAFLAAGIPPVIANASNTVALTLSNFVAAWADRERMPPWDRRFLDLIAVSVTGSVGGAYLLLATPEKAFTDLVPALIGFATALFAFSDRIKAWIALRKARAVGARAVRPGFSVASVALFLPVAIYGGYFGAGMSVMMLAVLSIGYAADYRTANVLKNLLSGLTSGVAAAVFVVTGAVAWAPTLILMAGAFLGGYAGGRLVRILPPPAVRWIVIGVGSVLTAVYAWRYWIA